MIKKPNVQTRSTVSFDAVAKAAANAGAGAMLAHPKFGAIAGLAGFVLRLFRQKATGASPRTGRPRVKRPRRARRSAPASTVTSAQKGGRRHG